MVSFAVQFSPQNNVEIDFRRNETRTLNLDNLWRICHMFTKNDKSCIPERQIIHNNMIFGEFVLNFISDNNVVKVIQMLRTEWLILACLVSWTWGIKPLHSPMNMNILIHNFTQNNAGAFVFPEASWRIHKFALFYSKIFPYVLQFFVTRMIS